MCALAGRSFVSLDGTVRAHLADPDWAPAIGRGLLVLPGGTEVVVLDEEIDFIAAGVRDRGLTPEQVMVPVRPDDPYMPPVRCEVPLVTLRERFNPVERGKGPRTGQEPVRCVHRDSNIAGRACMYCYRRWWRARAMAVGLEV